MISVFIFLTGLVFGSFANVVILRFNTGDAGKGSPFLIPKGYPLRSRCFSCNKRLRWFELLPVISFIVLHGKCRSCLGSISLQYPLVELASGLIFVLLFNFPRVALGVEPLGLPSGFLGVVEFILPFAFFWLLLVLSVYDIRHQILPDILIGALTAVALLFVMAEGIRDPQRILIHGLAGAALFIFFGALWFISRGRWMGLGDAKLAFALGLFLGPAATLVAFFLSFWLGALVGIGWVLVRRLRTLKIHIPFGPFLAIGAFVAYLWAGSLIEFYLRLAV